MTVRHASVQRRRAIEPDLPGRSDIDLAGALSAPSPGRPIESATRAWLESGFGHDFGNVQVHTDGQADALARSVHASAFTTDAEIYFREGAYDLDSPEGLRRLAHEGAHVLQQAAGPVAGDVGPDGVSVSQPDDAFERAADEAAERIVSNTAAAPRTGPSAATDNSGGAGEASVQRSFMGLDQVLEQQPAQGGFDPFSTESAPMPGLSGGDSSSGPAQASGGFAGLGETAGGMLGGLLGGPGLGGLGESAGSMLGGMAGSGLDSITSSVGGMLGGMAGSGLDSITSSVGGMLGGLASGIASEGFNGMGESAGSSPGSLAGGLLGGPLLGDIGQSAGGMLGGPLLGDIGQSAGSMLGGLAGGAVGGGLDAIAGTAGSLLGGLGGGVEKLADLF